MTYDNIKRHKKPGLDPLSFSLSLCLSVRYIFGKTTGDGSNWPPSLLRVKKKQSPQIMPPVAKHKRVHSNAKTENSSVDFDTLNFPEESVI